VEKAGCQWLTPQNRTAWDRFVFERADSAPFHLAGWGSAVEQAFRHQPMNLFAEENGEVTGILPLFLQQHRCFGRSLVSVPGGNTGGPLARDDATSDRLVNAAKQLATALEVDYVELRGGKLTTGWETVSDRFVTVLVDLDEEEATWSRLAKRARRYVRQARKTGLSASFGHDIDRFFPTYAASMKRLGSPAYGRPFFARLVQHLGDQAMIGIARHGQAVVAVDFLVCHKDCLYTLFAGSDPASWHLRSNYFLLWEELAWACRHGLSRFDFGRSRVGSQALMFKEAWGGRVVPINYQYGLFRTEQIPHISPDVFPYNLASRAWRRLPNRLAGALGPPLMKHLH
jgi:FemAB-related protein (PEP-CTERM system-associated)